MSCTCLVFVDGLGEPTGKVHRNPECPVHTEPSVPYIDPTKTTLENGRWYGFQYEGRQFFATVYNNGATGFLELTEILDPYVCLDCGKHWSQGDHGDDGHIFNPRGGELAGGPPDGE